MSHFYEFSLVFSVLTSRALLEIGNLMEIRTFRLELRANATEGGKGVFSESRK
jgi:hypothetical protein